MEIKIMDLSIIAIIISIIAILISLYFGFKQKQHSEAQHKIATEPDLKLYVDAPNSNPISINCRNSGARITDLALWIEDRREELPPHPHELFDEYFLHVPKILIEGKNELILKLLYRNKLGKSKEKLFIYDINNKKILPK